MSFFVFIIMSLNIFSNDMDDFNTLKKKVDIPQPGISIKSYSDKQIVDFMNDFSNIFGIMENPKEKIFTKSKSVSKVLYKFDLNPVKDKYLYTSLTFKTTKNKTVYVSITKSFNCPGGASGCSDSEKFMLTMTVDDKTYFAKIKDALNLSIFVSGSVKVNIDGDEYIIKVYGNISDINKSRIEIKRNNTAVLNKMLGDMIDEFASFGVNIKLNNKEYKVIYGRKIEYSPIPSFTQDNMVFIVEMPVSKNSSYNTIDEKNFNGKNIYFKSIGEQYLFNLNSGALIITYQ